MTSGRYDKLICDVSPPGFDCGSDPTPFFLQPFLAQAEQEKLEYEAARKLYEEGTTGYSSSINFSILPGNPINSIAFPSGSFLRPIVKQEAPSSESESDMDDSIDRRPH